MVPRFFQIRIWDPKSWPTPTKLGVPCNFCFIKFSPKYMVEAPEAPWTSFTHPIPKGWGYQVETPSRTFPPLEDHLRAKFHPDPSRGLDFYREQTNIHTHPNIALYVVEDVEPERCAPKSKTQMLTKRTKLEILYLRPKIVSLQCLVKRNCSLWLKRYFI